MSHKVSSLNSPFYPQNNCFKFKALFQLFYTKFNLNSIFYFGSTPQKTIIRSPARLYEYKDWDLNGFKPLCSQSEGSDHQKENGA